MRRRRDAAGSRAGRNRQVPLDEGLELQFSAQPGSAGAAPVFVPGSMYRVPAEVVSGMRQMLTRMVASDQWPRAVALTSALHGEGVSYTALALSAVLSQDTGKRVCLVDANWYSPAGFGLQVEGPQEVQDSNLQPATFNRPPQRMQPAAGLAAVLDGELELGDALVRVRHTEETRLLAEMWFLPAGQMPQSHRVIAARSPETKAVIAELREQFEYIVLDLPPVLATSDAIALAGLADASCLVVHQGVTPAAVVQEALAAIRHLPVLGVIMNQVRVYMPAGLAGQLTAPVVDGAAPANVAG